MAQCGSSACAELRLQPAPAGRVTESTSRSQEFFGPMRCRHRQDQERLLAMRLERAYSKDQDSALYLNAFIAALAPYGIAAAAMVYR